MGGSRPLPLRRSRGISLAFFSLQSSTFFGRKMARTNNVNGVPTRASRNDAWKDVSIGTIKTRAMYSCMYGCRPKSMSVGLGCDLGCINQLYGPMNASSVCDDGAEETAVLVLYK